jgi:large subunit ribosomal protein L29
MKMSEIKELSSQELLERLDNEKTMLVKMRLNHAISPLDNPMKIRYTRKNIARSGDRIAQERTDPKTNS